MSDSLQRGTAEFMDIETLSRIGDLEIQAAILASGLYAGIHKSPFLGACPEFKSYRDYLPGDQIKDIDWRAYARTDRLHIRLREDETNMNTYVLLDTSRSMDYRSAEKLMTKWQYARCLAATIFFVLSKQGDAASLALVGDNIDFYSKPRSDRSHYRQLLSAMCRKAQSSSCLLPEALLKMEHMIKARSMILVISDFYIRPERIEKQLGMLKHLNCETLFINVFDPVEMDLELDGLNFLKESESIRKMSVNSDLIKEDYRKNLNAHLKELDMLVSSYGGRMLTVKTSEMPFLALGTFFEERSRRLA
ncbi:MAG: DUF58 domain-containing protein [Victivallales bacterium]